MTHLHVPATPGRDRIVSISGAPYDGYPAPHMFESLARIGATHVEPAYIVGYTEPFDESSFTDERGAEYPAEHNVGHLYDAKPELKAFYRGLDPCNQFNPGIGRTSKLQGWR